MLDALQAKTGKAGMVCGQQLGKQFKNPIAATNDGVTNNLYIVEQGGVIHAIDLSNPEAGNHTFYIDWIRAPYVSYGVNI